MDATVSPQQEQAVQTAREAWTTLKGQVLPMYTERNAVEQALAALKAKPSAKAIKAELSKVAALGQRAKAAQVQLALARKLLMQAQRLPLAGMDQHVCDTIATQLSGVLPKTLDDVAHSLPGLAKSGKAMLVQLTQQADAAAEGRRLTGDLEVLLDADESTATETVTELKAAYDEGWKLFAKRDQAALEALKRQTRLPAELERLGRSYDEARAKLAAQPGLKALTAIAKAELAARLKPLDQRREALKTSVMECQSLKARLNDLRMAPIDLDRAVKHLELEREHKAELERAVQGDDAQMTRGLEAFAKKFKLKLGGRELLGRLKKAQLV